MSVDQVIKVDQELNAIVVHGSVPGKPGNVLELTPAKMVGKNFNFQRNLTVAVRNIKVLDLRSCGMAC